MKVYVYFAVFLAFHIDSSVAQTVAEVEFDQLVNFSISSLNLDVEKELVSRIHASINPYQEYLEKARETITTKFKQVGDPATVVMRNHDQLMVESINVCNMAFAESFENRV
jgi:type III secretory pathway component EscR